MHRHCEQRDTISYPRLPRRAVALLAKTVVSAVNMPFFSTSPPQTVKARQPVCAIHYGINTDSKIAAQAMETHNHIFDCTPPVC